MESLINCSIDRFEGDMAVLLVGRRQIDIPRSLLPQGSVEGDHLSIRISRDPESRNSAENLIADTQKRLKRKDR